MGDRVGPLIDALASPKDEVRASAIIELAREGPAAAPAVAPLLEIALNMANRQLASMAVTTPGKIGAREAVPGLVALLTLWPEHKLGSKVARTLGLIGKGAADALPSLRAGRRSRSKYVRVECRKAIALIEAALQSGGAAP